MFWMISDPKIVISHVVTITVLKLYNYKLKTYGIHSVDVFAGVINNKSISEK